MTTINNHSYSIPSIDNPLQGSNGRWTDSATKLGGALGSAEANLLKAFTFADEKDSGFKAFAKKMGFSGATLQGLQMALQIKYDKAKQAFTLLSQILAGANETAQRIIDKIGR
jgi:hypothetical protein